MKRGLVAVALVLVTMGAAFAQWWRSEPPDTSVDRNGTPRWEADTEHPEDVFTFARVKYRSWRRRGSSWATDYPDSDLNLSYRLHQLTSLKVHPDGRILELTDPELVEFPFIYMIEPGSLELSDDEVDALRKYLLGGGFLMVDDFWGEREWAGFYEQWKRVFPDREPVELPIEHPVFHQVFDMKEKPQIPSLHHWLAYRETAERYDALEPHYRAVFDDEGRMVAFIGHNTDLGDGWEREGEDPEYFKLFSEAKAYPLGINVLFYAMTH